MKDYPVCRHLQEYCRNRKGVTAQLQGNNSHKALQRWNDAVHSLWRLCSLQEARFPADPMNHGWVLLFKIYFMYFMYFKLPLEESDADRSWHLALKIQLTCETPVPNLSQMSLLFTVVSSTELINMINLNRHIMTVPEMTDLFFMLLLR